MATNRFLVTDYWKFTLRKYAASVKEKMADLHILEMNPLLRWTNRCSIANIWIEIGILPPISKTQKKSKDYGVVTQKPKSLFSEQPGGSSVSLIQRTVNSLLCI